MKESAFKIVVFLLASLLVSARGEARLLDKTTPKLRVAVAQFGATDRFTSVYGGWDIGGGLAAQLVTSLIETGRVVVVERAILSKVLMEQELGQARLSSPFTKIPAGQLLGVDYLIVGQVTEFEERQMGGGAGLAIMKGFGPKISADAIAAHVGIDLRVIDTRTGEILQSHRAQGRAWDKAFASKIDYKFIEFGGDVFHKTPLGQATRRAINDAIDFILEAVEQRTEDFSWLARVIEVEGSTLYFDAGRGAHIEAGDRFQISSVRKVLTDPETNEVLGLLERPTGQAEAVQVELKYTKAVKRGSFPVRVGDLVHFAERATPDAQHETATGYRVLE